MNYGISALIGFVLFPPLSAIASAPNMALETAAPASPPLDVPSTSPASRFFVECHCFIPAAAGTSQDYGYHLRAFGYPKSVPNGLEVTLDNNNILLSVTRREAGQEDYSPLYESIPPSQNAQQSCETSDCPLVEYEFPQLPEPIAIAYDRDRGVIFVEHQREDGSIAQGRGGCAFVALP